MSWLTEALLLLSQDPSSAIEAAAHDDDALPALIAQVQPQTFSIPSSCSTCNSVAFFHSSSAFWSLSDAFPFLIQVKASIVDSTDDVSLQENLFNLLGVSGFEIMGEIMQNVSAIRAAILQEGGGMPSSGTGRKRGKKKWAADDAPPITGKDGLGYKADTATASAWLRDQGLSEAAISGNRSGPRMVSQQPEVDLSQRSNISLAGTSLDDAQQLISRLPSGTTRICSKGVEEVTVPPPPPAPVGRHKLVPISAIAQWQRGIFSGLKQFNEVQSVVFNSAYNSSNNMLVCAPTGAGKTNIALLTIARELLLHMQDGVLHVADFKIVYVAFAYLHVADASAAASQMSLQVCCTDESVGGRSHSEIFREAWLLRCCSEGVNWRHAVDSARAASHPSYSDNT
jgi:hypothetical protein